MTDLQLKKLGIHEEKTAFHPNRYWCNVIQDYLTIKKDCSEEDVLSMVFENGYAQGIDTGKEQRSKEIMNLLTNAND